MIIKGRKIIIRAIEKKDLQFMLDMMNNEKIEKMTVGTHTPISYQQQEGWFENYSKNPQITRFIIENTKDGAIGMISLDDINRENQSLNLNIKMLEEKITVTGCAIDAFMAMFRFVFDYMNINRIECNTLDFNTASLNLQKNCGMVVEGTKRSAIYKNGKYRNIIITSILKDEYYEFVKNQEYWSD